MKNCCGICELKKKQEEYLSWIAEARKIIKGDAHEIGKELENEMLRLASEMKYEEAQRIKEKLELIELFRSKTIITNSAIKELDVFGYDEQDQNVYISVLHIHNGSIVQGQTIEYHRFLNEPKEEMLAHGIVELKEQLNSDTKEIIVPFLPDVIDENLHFHIAISGEKKRLLDLAMQNVKQYKQDRLKQADKLNPDQRMTRILSELQNLLKLESLPVFIDSFDNSNIQGNNPVAGCVVFKKAKPSKKDYKRFTIKSVEGPDDYASMREVVRRRYQHIIDENGDFPNLIIADGGIGQMNAIREVVEKQLNLHIPIAGLKKDDKHRTQTLLFGFPPKEFTLPVTSEVFRLLVQIQDEVHRFAISYHKNKRSKAQIHSQLDDIQGVGEVTKKKILLHFGSFSQAKKANEDEWVKLLGTKRGSAIYKQIADNLSR